MIPTYYRKPLLIALLLHVILLCVLLFNFAPEMFRAPPASAPVQLIHARAIMDGATQIAPTPQPVKTPPTAKPVQTKPVPQEKPADEKAQAVAKALAAKKMMQEKVLAAEKATAQKKLLAQKMAADKKVAAAKAAAAKQKAMAAKAQAILKADAQQQVQKAKEAAALKLQQEQKKLQQQLMQQQIVSEEKNVSAIVSQAQQGEIDKYKAEILAVIQSHWRIDKVDNKLKCIYAVSIAPDGTVLSETLVKSSGDDNLDQSAKQAIVASSPLPVPANPTLFNHFRQLVLTLSPQGYVGNS